jgi:hypothetical protein
VTGSTGSLDFPTRQALQPACALSPEGLCSYDAFIVKLNATGSRLLYATYLGGSGAEAFHNLIAVDEEGHAYVTGSTDSLDFPTRHALQPTCAVDAAHDFFCGDAFLTKVDARGQLLYSTYLGGSGFEGPSGIAVDREGHASVVGFTSSTDFPIRQALQPTCRFNPEESFCADAFIAKLTRAGSRLVYATYLGGSSDDGATDIAVDQEGNSYVVGQTFSPDFPTRQALQPALGGVGDASDGFIVKVRQ